MSKDLLLKRRSATASESESMAREASPLWPTIVVVALVVTMLVGLFVFVGSLPAIHERQKAEAARKGMLR